MDLKKVLQIVEGGFHTQEINSAFKFNKYDILSSKDESLSSDITSSEETESSTEDEELIIILPTPKRRKINDFVRNNNENSVSTCTKGVK